MPQFNAIVLSAMSKSGSSAIADELAKHYGWARFSAGDEFKRLATTANSELDATLQIWQTAGRSADLHEQLNSKLGIFLTKDLPNVVKVWVDADFEKRVELARLKTSEDPEQIKLKLSQRVQLETKEWARMYPEFSQYSKQKELANFVVRNAGTLQEVVKNIISELEKLNPGPA
jgi:cytidylate kinase